MSAFLRKFGAAATVRIQHLNAAGDGYATDSDWTPAAGDVKVSVDGAAPVNIVSLPTYTNGQWVYSLSGAEVSGASVLVTIADADGDLFDAFTVETYGSASAQHAMDLDATVPTVAEVADAVWDEFMATHLDPGTAGAILLQLLQYQSDYLITLSDAWQGGALEAVLDAIAGNVAGLEGAAMRGTDNALLAVSAPANFNLLAINGSGYVERVVLVDTTTENTDMRGTDNALLATSAPANFGVLNITAEGHVARVVLTDTATTASNMRGTDNALLAASAPANFGALLINGDGHVGRVTLVDTTTTNTDMRGTDGALLAANVPANFSTLDINGDGSLARVVLVDTTTTNTDMRGTDSALLAANVPGNFAALGITADGHVSRVVLVDTTTENSDMRGTDDALLADNYMPTAASAGSDVCTLKVRVSGQPLSDADVWVTQTPNPRVLLVDGTYQTNSNGEVVMMLDDGVEYYLHAQKDGVKAIQGKLFTAVADPIEE